MSSSDESALVREEEQVSQEVKPEAVTGFAPAPQPAPEGATDPEGAPAPAPKKPKKKPKKKKGDHWGAIAIPKGLHKASEDDEVIISFDHVTKTYNLYKNERGRIFRTKRKGVFLGSVNAVDDVSFEIRKGEAVAFFGRNGAGKSTTLKMVTGVTYPTKGTVEVNGRVSALLELTAGFDKQLTGRENIRMRGEILGLSAEETKALEPDILEFAELGVYADQPLRTYSSGMRARLGFAFAVAINPEILVVDEALSVGDKAFKKKCIARIQEIMLDEDVTVLFVTHASETAQAICSRGIVLDHGKMMFDGDIEEAKEYYETNY